ncbi:type II toxin-antitoxin system RelE/ParE family toxin [Paucibacter sp. PLA-PC-4]|uniref:type II toxin-antitoxin system RelE/ParE family toxin n=1 Tax=Paucibacter sp. PLA-PC-4 TaxID=2993655 RepID=UPI00224B1206|nr:type II toxin-antitoxin system RelE/ParE family toxin [Paucibacter sp. PLA-PC-4]MCX2863670.1 type II toxin-antitoxin system RelE/ParE family toxin [Paucibacter sp. PLA-PC-4]
MTSVYSATLLEEAVADLQCLEDFAIERELASETPDWTTPQRALDAISEGMRLLSWSPFSCRKAELGNGRSRELVVPFGSAGCVVLFEIVGNQVVVGAVRHQREEDYRH